MRALDPASRLVHVYAIYPSPVDMGYGNMGEQDVFITNCEEEVGHRWILMNDDALVSCLRCLRRRQ